ncbi:MAG: DUF4349 domain-containing protein [Bacteroidia bacterium]|nr:DUF4349 domain-containing protein [Bacteroidia bacterium]MDW8235486.1 DUF4349 domain-containing protein [Bacteroidia bacterium]
MRWSIGAIVAFVTACGGGGVSGTTASPSSPTQRLNASFTLIVDDWERSLDSVESWARAIGAGLLQREKQEAEYAFFKFLVPRAAYEGFIVRLRGLGEVLDERTSLTDISQGQSEIERKLALKDSVIIRFQVLLRQARTVSEIVEVEKALQQALSERQELLVEKQRSDSLSKVVELELTLRNAEYVEYREGGSYLAQLTRSFKEGWNGFIYFTFLVAYLWWLWLLIFLLIVGMRFYRRRLRS